MAVDLASLKTEILSQLEQEEFAIFYTDSGTEGLNVIYWDVSRYPDIRAFLAAAKRCQVRLIVFYERVFSQAAIDDVLERLESLEIAKEERRSYELRLRDLQKFEGFTCELEVFFDYGQHTYQYQVRTDWYEDFQDIFAEVTVGEAENYEEDEDEDDGPISGYFSRN